MQIYCMSIDFELKRLIHSFTEIFLTLASLVPSSLYKTKEVNREKPIDNATLPLRSSLTPFITQPVISN